MRQRMCIDFPSETDMVVFFQALREQGSISYEAGLRRMDALDRQHRHRRDESLVSRDPGVGWVVEPASTAPRLREVAA